MIDDDTFGTALHRALDTLEAPTRRLVDDAIAQGRRRRRLTYTARGLTGAALIAGVAVLGSALLFDGSPSPTPSHAGAARPNHSSTAPTGQTSPVGPPTPDQRVTLTPQALLKTALSSLPRAGRTTQYSGRSFDDFVGIEFVYDDGHGAAQVDVRVAYGNAETAAQFCADNKIKCPGRKDGSTLITAKSYSRPGDPSTARQWNADYFRADGVYISLSEWNAPLEKDQPATRPAPPFTIAQLSRWITGKQWQITITSAAARAAAGLFAPDADTGGGTSAVSAPPPSSTITTASTVTPPSSLITTTDAMAPPSAKSTTPARGHS